MSNRKNGVHHFALLLVWVTWSNFVEVNIFILGYFKALHHDFDDIHTPFPEHSTVLAKLLSVGRENIFCWLGKGGGLPVIVIKVLHEMSPP